MSQTDTILEKFRSQEYVSTLELNNICFRYSARLFDLRQAGYLFEKKRSKEATCIELWKLVAEPKPLQFTTPKENIQLSLI